MLDQLWAWVTEPANRDVITWIGGGLGVVIAGVWTVVKFFAKKPPSSVRADRGGVAFVGKLSNSQINTNSAKEK